MRQEREFLIIEYLNKLACSDSDSACMNPCCCGKAVKKDLLEILNKE